MRPTVIDYGDFRIRIKIRRPDAEVNTGETSKESPIKAAFDAFNNLGAQVKAPTRAPTGEDFGILTNLLKKYDMETLMEYARLFWRGHSDPVFDRGYPAMRLFAAKIPDIIREV